MIFLNHLNEILGQHRVSPFSAVPIP